MSAKDRPRLGRGLSGLLERTVSITVSPSIVSTSNNLQHDAAANTPRDAEAAGGDAADARAHALETESGATAPASAGLQRIPVRSIVPNRYQPRAAIDPASIEPLANSIRTSGVMQPIAVRPLPSPTSTGERYELVAGERRWRAAALAGLAEIPALIAVIDDQSAAEWAIVENVQREDLNPIDRALAYKRLMTEFGATHAQIAERVGLDRTSIVNTMRVLDLEEEVRELVSRGVLTLGHAKALLSGPAGALRIDAARRAASDGWSVRATERWASDSAIKQAGAVLKGEPSAIAGSSAARSAHIAALEKQLSEHLGTRVRIRTIASGKKGRIMLEFYSVEHFEGLMQRMGFRMES